MFPELQPDDPSSPAPEVGEFRQGTADSRRALSGYLVGRAIGEQTATGLMILGFAILALAVGAYFIGPTWLAVLVGLIGFGLLLVRAVVAALMRRPTPASRRISAATTARTSNSPNPISPTRTASQVGPMK